MKGIPIKRVKSIQKKYTDEKYTKKKPFGFKK